MSNEDRSNSSTQFGLDDELTFGKYEGETVREVVEKNYSYLRWVRENVEWASFSSEAVRWIRSADAPTPGIKAGARGFPGNDLNGGWDPGMQY